MKPLSGLTRKQKLIILACVGVIVLLVMLPAGKQNNQTNTTASQSQSILTTSENTSVEAFRLIDEYFPKSQL